MALLDRLGVRDMGTLWVQREASGDNGERPDFSIRDAQGRERAIIEAKFWAGLTDNQPLAYLDRLRGEDTVLIFMCPPSRVESLWTEIKQRCVAGGTPFVEIPTVSGGAEVGTSRMFVLSWQLVLRTITDETERQQDAEATADLEQIMDLAGRLDRADFVPLHAVNLAPDLPRALLSWMGIVDDIHERLLRDEVATRVSRRRTSNAYSYGLTIALDGISFWLGLWWTLWAETADTPFWLELMEATDEGWARAVSALDRLESTARIVTREHDQSLVVVPLFPPLGREKQVVIQSLVDTVTAIRDALVLEREAATGPSPSDNIDHIEVGPAS